MPLRSMQELRRRAEAGVVVCRTHGANCQKYPGHPVVREREKPDAMDLEFVEMVRTGHLLRFMGELADAGYELPEEFTRTAEERPRGDRVREFFERYDLGKHFRPDGPEPSNECKTRKLSDEEIRQRREYAVTVREAQRTKYPPPLPPWEKKLDPQLAEMMRRSRGQFNAERAAERAERVNQLRDDADLGAKLQEALATWVSLPPRYSAHTQDVREGYGNAVPEFEEME